MEAKIISSGAKVEKYSSGDRQSGIELLKIFSILIIILNHVLKTLCESNAYVANQEYLLDCSHVTTDAWQLILAILRYSGNFGNILFFICSAWFLLDKKVSNKKKCVYMIADVQIFSLFFLGMAIITNHGHVAVKLVIKALFPIIFDDYWYITCYVLFYLLCPLLNIIIHQLTKERLLRIDILLAILYIGINYVLDDMFFSSILIVWVVIYFLVAYIKFFMPQFQKNIGAHTALVFAGAAGNFGMIFLTNMLGLKFSFFADKLLYWNKICSPFLIMMAIGLFSIALGTDWKNKFVNAVSGCSMLIYIIHENLMVRTYYRTAAWQYIFARDGHRHVFSWIFVQVLVIFAISFLISILYKKLCAKKLHAICDKIVCKGVRIYKWLEICLLNKLV